MCQGVPPVKPLDNFNAIIPEAYDPKLDSSVAGQKWVSRAPNSKLSDVILDDSTPFNKVFISEVEEHKKRLLESVKNGTFRFANDTKLLGKVNIEQLGDMTEASYNSVNRKYYGDFGLHNEVHVLLAFVHHPKFRKSVNFF